MFVCLFECLLNVFQFINTRYQIMMRCWQNDPDGRPTFTEMRNQLKDMETLHKRLINMEMYDKYLYANSGDCSSQLIGSEIPDEATLPLKLNEFLGGLTAHLRPLKPLLPVFGPVPVHLYACITFLERSHSSSDLLRKLVPRCSFTRPYALRTGEIVSVPASPRSKGFGNYAPSNTRTTFKIPNYDSS
ncbi:uncharacterized protein LOC111332575 isoform X1 [Stylophora pistillata]|uniref:uncharacterized protein LOC111332575 isoform X1 n=1 Tax=Stylophora pistillata TaxID=50429 RepID=UPI000C03FDBD|nr:uncharacterized protein LOC111332575 isoform X1 [Stylophora pistillata]